MARNIRFYSGRQIPKGMHIRVTEMGPAVFVEGSVPGGPVVRCCATIVDDDIVLDDNIWFEHEFKPKNGVLIADASKINGLVR